MKENPYVKSLKLNAESIVIGKGKRKVLLAATTSCPRCYTHFAIERLLAADDRPLTFTATQAGSGPFRR